jgi:hypothetical protein
MITIKVKDKVKLLLETFPHLRDSDERLTANIWLSETPKDATAFQVLQMYAEKRLTNAESIRRTRAKLQEEIPELRGKSYNLRHKSQDRILDELGYQINSK